MSAGDMTTSTAVSSIDRAERERPDPRPNLRPATPGRSPLAVSHAPDAVLRRDALFRRLLAVADLSAAALGLVCVVLAADVEGIEPGGLIALPIVVVVAKLLGLYDRDELVFHKSTLDEVPKLFQLAALYAMLVWFLQAVFLVGPVDRLRVVVLLTTFFLCVVVGRVVARQVARREAASERCLIVGRASARLRFAGKLAQAHGAIDVVGYLPLEDERRQSRPPNGNERRRQNHRIEDLEALVSKLDVHRVVIIPGSADPETMLDSIGRAKTAGVKVSIVPRLFEVVGSSVEFDDLDGLTVLGVRRFGLTRSSLMIKRAMDAAGAALMLLILAPLFAVTALAIRLNTRGPVFFRQTRVGKDGERFEMFKFRSMIDGAEKQRAALAHLNEGEGMFKITDDPRVTTVGRLLRRTSMDELPQLINVLRGEMSLVGPRPLVLEEDSRVQGRHRRRLRLVPGITGPWQLLGPTRVSLNEMVTIDYLYGANWSLWKDVKILLRTLGYVLTRRGL